MAHKLVMFKIGITIHYLITKTISYNIKLYTRTNEHRKFKKRNDSLLRGQLRNHK